MFELLDELCALPGVSGHEDAVRAAIRAKVTPFAEEIYEDSIGNLFVKKRGRARRHDTLMVCAHMDEVGMIVKEITDEGYLRIGCVGGVDRRVLLGKRVRIGDAGIPGIVGVRAVHLSTKEEQKTIPKLDTFYLDIGAKDAAQAKKLVSLGDAVCFTGELIRLGEDQIKGKALDDRIGCAVMIRLLESELAYDTWFVFTVQEEVGLRGATCAAYTLAPDRALVLDGTTAPDLPGILGHRRVCELERGVVIGCMDGRTIYDHAMFETLRRLAEEQNIPWQTKELIAGGTDAGAIQQSRTGVRVASLAAPVRYLHSPACVTSLSAVCAMETLAHAFVNEEEA